MEKFIAEIKRIKNDPDPLLDRKCIGLYNTMVVFLDDGSRMNLTESYFKDKNSCFDYSYAGCYITPGKVTTIREIHIYALECEILNIRINAMFDKYDECEIKLYLSNFSDLLDMNII